MTLTNIQYRPRLIRRLPACYADIFALQPSIASTKPFISADSRYGRSYPQKPVPNLEAHGKSEPTYAPADNELRRGSSCYRLLGAKSPCEPGGRSRRLRAPIRRREAISITDDTGSIQLDAPAILAIQGSTFTSTLAIPSYGSKFGNVTPGPESG